MATHPHILTRKIPWTEKPGRLLSMELQSQTQLSNWGQHTAPINSPTAGNPPKGLKREESCLHVTEGPELTIYTTVIRNVFNVKVAWPQVTAAIVYSWRKRSLRSKGRRLTSSSRKANRMGKKGEMSLLSLGILGLLEKLTWLPRCFGPLVSFPRQLLHAAWSACPRVNLNKWVIPRKDFWPPSPPNCSAFANHIRTSASSEWGWKSCKNMFPRGWFWDFLLLVSAKTRRAEAEGGLERQREDHFTGGTSPLSAKDSIRVWCSSLWLSFNLNQFYHSIIYKELCFVVRLPEIQPTASLCLNQHWNIQARWWGMGPAQGLHKPCFGSGL